MLLEKLLADVKRCWVGCGGSYQATWRSDAGASIHTAFTPLLSFLLTNVFFGIITYKMNCQK